MYNCAQSFSPSPFAHSHIQLRHLFSLLCSLCLAFVNIVPLRRVPKILSLMKRLAAHILLKDFGTSNPFWKEADTNEEHEK